MNKAPSVLKEKTRELRKEKEVLLKGVALLFSILTYEQKDTLRLVVNKLVCK